MMLPIHSLIVLFCIVLAVVVFIFYNELLRRNHRINELLKDKESIRIQSNATSERLDIVEEKKEQLKIELEYKQTELINFALNIIQKNTFLEELKHMVNDIKSRTNESETLLKLNQLSLNINQHIALDKNRKLFQLQLEDANREFYLRVNTFFPNLNSKEKRLLAYIRLKLSSKEIASLLNIAPKSVEINRYRLRKKLGISSGTSLTDFVLNI